MSPIFWKWISNLLFNCEVICKEMNVAIELVTSGSGHKILKDMGSFPGASEKLIQVQNESSNH